MAVNQWVVGSSPTQGAIYVRVAQMEEHLTFNQGVEGSSPSTNTKYGGIVQWKDCSTFKLFCILLKDAYSNLNNS